MLVVGPNKVKIQVSSSFLKHISPVFRAMLNSSMSEGEAIRNRVDESPIEILLPQDNPRAMTQMLQGLYGVDAASQSTSGDLVMVTILADKYDMIKQLKYFGVYWMRALGSFSGPTSLQCQWDILITAYMLKEDHFFFVTSKAITKTKGSLSKYAMSTHDRELGLRLGSKFMSHIYHKSHILILNKWPWKKYAELLRVSKGWRWGFAWTASSNQQTLLPRGSTSAKPPTDTSIRHCFEVFGVCLTCFLVCLDYKFPGLERG